jgi:hypothetical protein
LPFLRYAAILKRIPWTPLQHNTLLKYVVIYGELWDAIATEFENIGITSPESMYRLHYLQHLQQMSVGPWSEAEDECLIRLYSESRRKIDDTQQIAAEKSAHYSILKKASLLSVSNDGFSFTIYLII